MLQYILDRPPTFFYNELNNVSNNILVRHNRPQKKTSNKRWSDESNTVWRAYFESTRTVAERGAASSAKLVGATPPFKCRTKLSVAQRSGEEHKLTINKVVNSPR